MVPDAAGTVNVTANGSYHPPSRDLIPVRTKPYIVIRMPLRLVEITLPSNDEGTIAALLEKYSAVDVFTSRSAENVSLVRLLVQAEALEALSDAFISHFGSREGFRIVVLAAEATMPPLEEPEKETPDTEPTRPSETKSSMRISREELYEDVAHASQVTTVYVVMVALSTVVAAVGLVRGEVATLVGAMVIAPLLGPNIALSLACSLADPKLLRRSLRAIAVGISVAGAISLLFGMLLKVDPAEPVISARTHVDIADIALALSAGTAGALAFTSGVPAVVVGVMVAVALHPPLVVAGLLVGSGDWNGAAGGLMLALTNVTCVNLSAIATFFVQKVRPRTWWEAEKAKKATRIAVTIWAALLALLVTLMFVRYA